MGALAQRGERPHVFASLQQLQSMKPDAVAWEPETLPRCRDYRPAHTVEYPYVGANCKVWQPQPEENGSAATAEAEAK